MIKIRIDKDHDKDQDKDKERRTFGRVGENALLAFSILLAPLWIHAASLDNTIDLDSNLPIPLDSGTQNVVTNGAGCYDFADRLGNGSSNAVTPVGLNLGGFDLYTGNTDDDIWLSLNGGAITGTTGNIHITANGPKDIRIEHVGEITMGDGSIYLQCGTSINGDIYIGQDGVEGPRAGPIQANVIRASSSAWRSGGVFIHSSGDVLIQDSSGTSTNLDVSTGGSTSSSGGVLVRHDGTFSAYQVLSVNRKGCRDIVFDGDAEDNGASGTFTADRVDTHIPSTNFTAASGSSGSISISNYLSATLGPIETRKLTGGATGDLLVTGIVNEITINGSIDLRNHNPANHGSVGLYAGGVITVDELDLSVISRAVIDSGGKSYIMGPITGTDGQPASGLGNIGTSLRAPAGEVIYYAPEETPTLNGTYLLADLAGTPGAGGRLRPKPKGTVVVLK